MTGYVRYLSKPIENTQQILSRLDIELTERCNNNCVHCCINVPASNNEAKSREMNIHQISRILREAALLGCMQIVFTGGEPLLHPNFVEAYLITRRLGMKVCIFTNACLITDELADLFVKIPPLLPIEVSIYGMHSASYEAVTRTAGSFQFFWSGIQRLLARNIPFVVKSALLQQNWHEMTELEAINEFGRKYTKDYYRFDPVLHLRYDRNESRNQEIKSERLTPAGIVQIEYKDNLRFRMLKDNSHILIDNSFKKNSDNSLFHCGAGQGNFVVGWDGAFKLCSALCAPGTLVNLRRVTLKQAYYDFVPHVRSVCSDNTRYLESCHRCPIINLCLHCPAHAYLETGELDGETEYFCNVAHARADAITKLNPLENN